jgi:hypothetical protein
MAHPRLGRFAEPALWILVALRAGPAGAATLFDTVRSLDGPIGPGRFIGALARLERTALVERSTAGRQPMYRLASYPDEPAR